MPKVGTATPYDAEEMRSLGRASGMYIRQFKFPDTYDVRDKRQGADHDRVMQADHDHACACFERHTKSGDLNFGSWVQNATDEKILAFAKDMLKADPATRWNGYRILGTVNRSNGSPVWFIEIFAKHPETSTDVYTGPNAPNVARPCRY